jgi:hypothetical protein
MKATGNMKVFLYNFSHLTVNPRNAMFSQQIQLMHAAQHSTAQHSNSHAISAAVSA